MRGRAGLLQPVARVGGHGGALEPVDGAREPEERAPEYVSEVGWREFLRSWKLAALLAVGCVAGLLAIFSVHPFGSSVSDRVSEELGVAAACAKAGEAAVAGATSTIYTCTIATGTKSSTQCFVVSDGGVRQVVGVREFGC